MSFDSQSNTQRGKITRKAGEDLTGLEGRLVLIASDGDVELPGAITDHVPYVLVRGAASGEPVDIEPLEPGKNARVRLNGTCNPGVPLCLDAINGTNDGKLRTIPATTGTYRIVAISEETGADEQLVLVRPYDGGNVAVAT